MTPMTDDTTLSLQTRISNIRHNGRDLRVIRPRHLAPGIVLQGRPKVLHMEVDRLGLEQLIAAWSLAVFSPRSIIFLPLRQNTDRSRVDELDLVFLHSSLQFRLAQWKQLRSRLGTGDLHTAKPAPPVLPTEPDPERWTQRQSRNGVVFDSAAQTLFVVGTRDGFRTTGYLADRLHTDPKACFDKTVHHPCVMLNCGRRHSETGRHATPGILHIQLTPTLTKAPIPSSAGSKQPYMATPRPGPV